MKNYRIAGEEWIVTHEMAHIYIPDVYEEVVGVKHALILNSREYCVIVNPFDPKTMKTNQWGRKVLKKGKYYLKYLLGPAIFFLQPGEVLEHGIEKVIILSEDEALLLLAKEGFIEDAKFKHESG